MLNAFDFPNKDFDKEIERWLGENRKQFVSRRKWSVKIVFSSLSNPMFMRANLMLILSPYTKTSDFPVVEIFCK